MNLVLGEFITFFLVLKSFRTHKFTIVDYLQWFTENLMHFISPMKYVWSTWMQIIMNAIGENSICNDIKVYESEFSLEIPYFKRNLNACAYSCPRVNIIFPHTYVNSTYIGTPTRNLRSSHVEPRRRGHSTKVDGMLSMRLMFADNAHCLKVGRHHRIWGNKSVGNGSTGAIVGA